MRRGARCSGVLALAAGVAGCYAPSALVTTPEGRARWATDALAAAEARPATCPSGALRLADAVALGVARSPEVAALRARARASAVAAEERPREKDPELRVGTVRLDGLIDGDASFGVGPRVWFERPGTLSAAADEDRLGAEVAAGTPARARPPRGKTWPAPSRAPSGRAGRARASRAPSCRGLPRRRREGPRRREREPARARRRRRRARRRPLGRDAGRARRRPRAGRSAATPRPPGELRGRDLEPAEAPAGVADADALVARALGARGVVAGRTAWLAASEARIYQARAAAWPWIDFAQIEWFASSDPAPDAWGVSSASPSPLPLGRRRGRGRGGRGERAARRGRARRPPGRGRGAGRRAAWESAEADLAEADAALAAWRAASPAEARPGVLDRGRVYREQRRGVTLAARRAAAEQAAAEALAALEAAVGRRSTRRANAPAQRPHRRV
ncbi:MAG: hypothetical protein H6745_02310 [Deltaproteobacteria bacterium]|nr:hypothetical protein [Deltaproteobacteria bacterium]